MRASMLARSPPPPMMCGVVLVDDHAPRLSELGQLHILELEADFLGHDRATGQRGHVLKHRFATIAEARRLHGDAAEHAANLVHDERGERFAFDFFRDDQNRSAATSPPARATESDLSGC